MRSSNPAFPPGSLLTLGLCFAIAAMGLAGSQAGAAAVDAKRVVDTNTALPGGPFEPGSSSTFTTLFSGSAAEGRLVFDAWVQGEFGIILGKGLYSVDVGGGEPLVIADTRTCVQEPCDESENVFGDIRDNVSFDGATVVFGARLGGFSGPVGIWTAKGGVLEEVVRDGDSNPAGGSFGTFESPTVDGGEIAFTERSFNAEQGVFAAPTLGGNARVVADASTTAPGGGGALFDPASMNKVAYRDGLLVFRGELDNGAQGLYVEDDSGLRIVVDPSIVAPSLDGATFTSIASFLTDGGDIVFVGGTPSLSTGRGIYVERDGTLLPAPIMLARSTGGTRDPCDSSTRLLFLSSLALGGGSVVFVSEGGLYSARIGTSGLSRLLVSGDTVDGKTVAFLGGGTLHPEALADGAVYPLLEFTDGSMGIYCIGIPETAQCGPAPVPDRCLTVPEPRAKAAAVTALLGLAGLCRRRARRVGRLRALRRGASRSRDAGVHRLVAFGPSAGLSPTTRRKCDRLGR